MYNNGWHIYQRRRISSIFWSYCSRVVQKRTMKCNSDYLPISYLTRELLWKERVSYFFLCWESFTRCISQYSCLMSHYSITPIIQTRVPTREQILKRRVEEKKKHKKRKKARNFFLDIIKSNWTNSTFKLLWNFLHTWMVPCIYVEDLRIETYVYKWYTHGCLAYLVCLFAYTHTNSVCLLACYYANCKFFI